MKCKHCQGRLRIVKTVIASPHEKAQEADCLGCGTRWTLVSLIFCENNGRGKGGKAVAKYLPLLALRPR